MATRTNPLIWAGLLVLGLVLYLIFGSERGGGVEPEAVIVEVETYGEIDRNLLIPPGMRARQAITQMRESEKPWPLDSIFDRAEEFQRAGNLADAHLLYFFAAREGYLPAIMKMGEIYDPTMFRAENSLLDQADSFQAFKWYQKALDQDSPGASERLSNLQSWALAESKFGNADATQLLLNFQ